jgi:hypothetical protein
MKLQYDFFLFLAVCMKTKYFFPDIYIYATFHRKLDILISNLYFYNIKIKPLNKYAKKPQISLFFLFLLRWAGSLAD